MHKQRLCKLCHKRFAYDTVKEGTPGTKRFQLGDKDVGFQAQDATTFCLPCVMARVKMLPLEKMRVSRYTIDGEKFAITWEQDSQVIRAFVGCDPNNLKGKIAQESGTIGSKDELEAAITEAQSLGFWEIEAANFVKVLLDHK